MSTLHQKNPSISSISLNEETNFKGSSNSQDSFPPPGSTPTSMDGYGGYPSGYPPGTGPGYNEPSMQRPPSQNNAQTPHTGTYSETYALPYSFFILHFYFLFIVIYHPLFNTYILFVICVH